MIRDTTFIQVADFNGDGKSDLMVFNPGYVTVYSIDNSYTLVTIAYFSEIGIKTDRQILMGDYNGDGKTDFCIPQLIGSDSWNFYFSNGTSFGAINTTIGTVYSPAFYARVSFDEEDLIEQTFIASDFNGDGKTDILRQANFTLDCTGYYWSPINCDYRGTPVKTVLSILENTGCNGTSISFNMSVYNSQYTGVGRNPLVAFTNHNQVNKNLEYSLISNNMIIVFKSPKDNKIDTALKTITNGNGVQETITYKPLKNEPCGYNGCNSVYYSTPETENYPNTDIVIAPAFKVVNQITKQSASFFKKQSFMYYGAVINSEGLGFIGFKGRTSTNWVDANDTNLISTVSLNDISLRGANVINYAMIGFYGPQSVVPTSGFISKSVNTYNIDNTTGLFENPLQTNKVFKVKNTKSEQFNELEGTSSSSLTVYNIYNNPTTATTTVKNGTITEQVTSTSIGYNDVPTAMPYIIGRPVSKTQNLQIYPNQTDADTSITEELYDYNLEQLLSKITKRTTNSGLQSPDIVEDNTFDSYGNITKKIIKPTGETARETNYQYDASYGYRFMTKSIDIELLETDFTYDPSKGLLLTEKLPSISANYPLLTTYTYDKWGKKLTVKDYLNQIKTFTYTNTADSTTITSSATDGSASSEIFDKLGRKTQSSVKNINAGFNLNTLQSYQYDIYDRTTKTSDPFFAGDTPSYNETKYDQYGRVYQTIDAKGKTTTITYPTTGLSVSVNDGTKTKTTIKNALGNVISVTDSPIGGTINYKYFANGNIKQTIYDGFATTITQDAWGRKKTLNDPSAGLYTYDYNGFGETLKEITPKGFTEYTYTSVGKLDTKWVKDASTPTNTNIKSVYAYYPTSKLLNTITVTNPYDGDSNYLYTYDNWKRLDSTTETFTGTIPRNFIKNITFDLYGRVLTETNTATAHGKSSIKTTNNTYRNGYLYQIFDGTTATGTALWQQNSENARGQLTTAILGNGTGITNTYNTYGYVTKMKHDLTATAANIMTIDTDFHQTRGNLNSRSNSTFAWTESFGYDDQDRLTSWNNALGLQTTQSYTESGKITANNLGTYNYNKATATPPKPYQNTSVTLSTDGLAYYGTLGNQLISYNSFKSPIEITNGSKKISFGYNAMEDRSIMYYGSNATANARPYRKYYSGDGSVEVRYTLAQPTVGSTPAIPEKVEFYTYIGGDAYSAPLVALKIDNGIFNNYYLHRDYQGSILAITNQQGVKVEERLFDAWGSLIKLKINGILSPLPSGGVGGGLVGLLLDRGYTGHEHLWTVGLVHMNARLYDPKLHRFLQPDNYVQEPNNTQNFNRYGYCLNNPLKYTDVSGEIFGWDDLGVVFLGGVINWALNGAQFNAAGLAYFGTGMAAGIATYYGGPLAGAAVVGAGNNVIDQKIAGKKFDIGQLIGATVTSVAITAATLGIAKAVFPTPRPQVSVITKLDPVGLAGKEGATLGAETAIASQATSTTIENTAINTVLNTKDELAKVGIEGISKLKCGNCGIINLEAVNVAAKGANKASGTYILKFASGNFYVGKGLESRMLQSTNQLEKDYFDEVISKEFFPANNWKDAFKLEHIKMMELGGPKSFDKFSPTYNKIFSPGRVK